MDDQPGSFNQFLFFFHFFLNLASAVISKKTFSEQKNHIFANVPSKPKINFIFIFSNLSVLTIRAQDRF